MAYHHLPNESLDVYHDKPMYTTFCRKPPRESQSQHRSKTMTMTTLPKSVEGTTEGDGTWRLVCQKMEDLACKIWGDEIN